MKFDPISPADKDRLKPLWLALHHHHQIVAPQLAPFVTDEVSWANRKRQYDDVFSGEYFGRIARLDGKDVGYLLCARRPMQWQATFNIPPDLWELVTLIVLPEARGTGVGKTLLKATDDYIATSDIQTRLIGVIPSNIQAVELYRKTGHVPAWVTLTRYQRVPFNPVRIDSDATIEIARAQDVDSLEGLWLSLHHHHQEVSPHLGPWVDDRRSWPVVRELFCKSAKDELLLVSKQDGRPCGLAAVAIYDVADNPMWTDTLVTDSHLAETKFLVVDESMRGKGLGTALMRTVDAALEARGVRDHFIGAIAPNRDAIRFYESLGYRQSWVEMLKL